ncbi:MAG: nucleoside hydrolase [Caldilineaceae bacterium]|nr:nucleoside hydrolase [Caldilineaceae bacterium]
MAFPSLSESLRIERLAAPTGPVRMVLDTDTYNEIDDQFALVWALLSREKLAMEAIYAAPFHNARSTGPGDGMERSYDEIHRLLDRLPGVYNGPVLRGSTEFMQAADRPVASDAAADLVERAMASASDDPLYVVAIGAPTNVTSALLLEPRIVERIVLVWLGGHPLFWPTAREFNLRQDMHASRLLFDSGVPFVMLPCATVASHLLATVPELEAYLAGQGAIGDFLVETFKGYSDDHFGWSKEIWDLAPIAWLLNSEWTPSVLEHSPILTDQVTWSIDRSRHLMRIASGVRRNPIFADLFGKVAAYASR